MSDTDELKHAFWKALAASPFLFLNRDASADGAVPMTAQLDKDANGAIWFFTSRNNDLAAGGPATAMFASKDNQLFARFKGVLSEETSRERLDQHWSPMIEAWFPGGKDDPDLLLLRMDLGAAELWNSDLGFVDNVKMLLGFDTRSEAEREHARTTL